MSEQLVFPFFDTCMFLDKRTLDDVDGYSTIGGVTKAFAEILRLEHSNEIYETSLINEQV